MNAANTDIDSFTKEWRKKEREWDKHLMSIGVFSNRSRGAERKKSVRHPRTLYFISDGNYIKIGIANNVEERIKQLQTGNPNKLFIVSQFENRGQLEKAIHKKFSHLHVGGEWFQYTNEIKEYLNE